MVELIQLFTNVFAVFLPDVVFDRIILVVDISSVLHDNRIGVGKEPLQGLRFLQSKVFQTHSLPTF